MSLDSCFVGNLYYIGETVFNNLINSKYYAKKDFTIFLDNPAVGRLNAVFIRT